MKNSFSLLLALFIFSLLLRILYLNRSFPEFDNDERLYVSLMENIYDGKGYVINDKPETFTPPLFPSIYVAYMYVFGNSLVHINTLSLLLSSLLPLMVFPVVRKMYSRSYAIWSVIFTAIIPSLQSSAGLIYPDILYSIFLFWFISLWQRNSLLLASIVMGFAYLVRPEAFFFAVLWILLLGLGNRKFTPGIPVIILLYFVTISFFLFYLFSMTGRVSISGKDRIVYSVGIAQYIYKDKPVEYEKIEQIEQNLENIPKHIINNPELFVKGWFYRFALLLKNFYNLIPWYYFLFTIIGVYSIIKTREKEKLFLLFLLTIIPFLPLGMTFKRHILHQLPLVGALSGIGFSASIQIVIRKFKDQMDK